MPFSFKRHILEPVKRIVIKLKAATLDKLLDKLPKRPRRTAWERIDGGFMEGRWERVRAWWRRKR